MNYGNIKPSLVVGWLKVKLLSDSRFLWSLLCEEGAWNRVDCKVYGIIRLILLKLFMRNVTNVLLVNPFSLGGVK